MHTHTDAKTNGACVPSRQGRRLRDARVHTSFADVYSTASHLPRVKLVGRYTDEKNQNPLPAV